MSSESDPEVLDGTPIPNTVIAVVLAAGAGSRFAGPQHKLLAPIAAGVSIIESALTNVLDAGFSKVIVVTGSITLPDAITRDDRLVVVHNSRWAEGQSSSLRAGIDSARQIGCDAVVIGLGYQPFIDPRAWRRVALADTPIAVASYHGHRGHPVKLDQGIWDDLPERGDFGARDLIRMHPEQVSQVDCPGSASDIDTQEDLAQWT